MKMVLVVGTAYKATLSRRVTYSFCFICAPETDKNDIVLYFDDRGQIDHRSSTRGQSTFLAGGGGMRGSVKTSLSFYIIRFLIPKVVLLLVGGLTYWEI